MGCWYRIKDGAITWSANFRERESDLYSEVDVVHGAGGKLYFIGSEPEAPAPTLGETRTAKLAEINAGYSSAMGFIQAGYPTEEILSWERQGTQARELVQNPKAEAAFVRGLASAKNLSIEEMCARILANAEDWEPVAAMLTGARQVMEEAAHAAETVEELQAIKVTYRV